MIRATLTCLALVASFAVAHPVLDTSTGDVAVGRPSDGATRLYRDSEDPNLWFVAPKRVVLADDPLTQRPLFRLAFSAERGDGELLAVFRLGFDEAAVAARWGAIRAENPRAVLRMLPVHRAELGIEFRSPSFQALIGRAEVVTSDVSAAQLPVRIALTPSGLAFLKAQAESPTGKLLALTMTYESSFVLSGDRLEVQTSPRELVAALRADPVLRRAFAEVGSITEGELANAFVRAYPSAVWSYGDPTATLVPLRSVARLFAADFRAWLASSGGPAFDPLRGADLDGLELGLIAAEPRTFSVISPGAARRVRDAAGVALVHVCDRLADAVYVEETGEARCLDLPLGDGGAVGGEDLPWIPDFP
jgi:hypothetical protein